MILKIMHGPIFILFLQAGSYWIAAWYFLALFFFIWADQMAVNQRIDLWTNHQRFMKTMELRYQV